MNKILLAAAALLAGHPAISTAAGDLEQITVTASRIEIPKSEVGVSVSVLTETDIQRLGYNSLLDVIRTLPGISVSNSGGAGKVSSVYVRGESHYRTLVLVDGVNIADPSAPQVSAHFQYLQARDIERVEVLRGPQGMMYGAGAGGVINIITRRAEEPLELSVGLEAGRFGTRNASAGVGGKRDNWSYGVDLSSAKTDGFNARESDPSGERDGYENRTGGARLGYQFSDRFSLEGQLRHTDADSEYDACYDAGFAPTDDCMDQFEQTSASVAGNYQGEAGTHKFQIARQEIHRDGLSLGEQSFAFEGAVEELNYVGNSALAGGELLWGAELEQWQYRDGTEPRDLDNMALFSEWRGDMGEKVYYTLGYRRDNLESEDHNSWRASMAYPVLLGPVSGLTQQLKYRASFATGFRAPGASEVIYQAETLGPETSRGYELGLDYTLAELLRLELALFDQDITDMIVWDFADGGYVQDSGESRSKGAELSLSGKLGERLDWYANGTWLDSTDAQGAQRLAVAQRVYNLGLGYSLLDGRLTLNGNWQHLADRQSPDPLTFAPVALDSYGKLDLKALYRLTDSVSLSLRGENVLDEDYREVAGFNTAGAAVYAGVQLAL